jgi:pyrrolysine biosynthesis protein PylC
MTVVVVGGGALGQQACRLAKAAGMKTILVDKDKDCPAAALADQLSCQDALAGPLPAGDYVLPALEDQAVLDSLRGENVLFDHKAWALTASRLGADAFLREQGIPAPEYFPGGSEPYIVKPDHGSFGRGIWVTEDFCEVGGAVNGGFVTQEELDGDVWSVVALGKGAEVAVYAPAKLTFDSRRRRIEASCEAAPEQDMLCQTACQVAQAIGVQGLLEVEAIFHHGVWKVVDLNARLPMLTPDAILEATGKNVLADLCQK